MIITQGYTVRPNEGGGAAQGAAAAVTVDYVVAPAGGQEQGSRKHWVADYRVSPDGGTAQGGQSPASITETIN